MLADPALENHMPGVTELQKDARTTQYGGDASLWAFELGDDEIVQIEEPACQTMVETLLSS